MGHVPNAQKYGIGADQLDSAMGWNAGTSNNWIQQNGLNPLGGAQQGMGAAAGGILSANSYPGANGNRTQYGYAQNPTQSGYYQQDTPLGSFAGASRINRRLIRRSNPYIGAQSQRHRGVGPCGAATAGPIRTSVRRLKASTIKPPRRWDEPYAGSNPFFQPPSTPTLRT